MNKDKKQNIFQKIAYYSGIIIIGVAFGFALQFASAAWSEPPIGTIAPGNNVEPPLNTGVSEQTKAGNLNINNVTVGTVIGSLYPSWTGLANKNMAGAVGSYALLQNTTGNYTLINKADTGDGFIGFRVGNASRMVVMNNGNVGIGTEAPTATLHVNGQIRIIGGNPGTGKVLTTDSSGLADWRNDLNINSLSAASNVNANNLLAAGDVRGSRLCIGADCKNAWPSGGGNCRLEIRMVGGLGGACLAGWQFIVGGNPGSNGAYCVPTPAGVALSNSSARSCGDFDSATCGRVVCD